MLGTSSLRIAVPAIPSSIDPVTLLAEEAALRLAGNAYFPLPGQPGIPGSVWEAIEPLDDGQTYEARLAAGVRSARGELLTTDDVIWSWSRIFALGGQLEQVARAAGVDGFEAVDYVNRQTVRFRLNRPNRGFPRYLLNGLVPLLDSKTARRHATTDDVWAVDWLSRQSAGFGAYAVVEFTPGQSLSLNGVPGAGVAFDEIIVAPIASAEDRARAIEAGDCDLALEPAGQGTGATSLGQQTLLVPGPGDGEGGATLSIAAREGLVGLEASPICGIILALLRPSRTGEGR